VNEAVLVDVEALVGPQQALAKPDQSDDEQ